MTDIIHKLQVFEDCLTLLFHLLLLLLCSHSGMMRYIYLGQKVRKPCNVCFTSLAQLNTRRTGRTRDIYDQTAQWLLDKCGQTLINLSVYFDLPCTKDHSLKRDFKISLSMCHTRSRVCVVCSDHGARLPSLTGLGESRGQSNHTRQTVHFLSVREPTGNL